MKTFSDNFTTPSVQDWLEKAEKDLKGKSLEELSWSWSEDLIFQPIHFHNQQNDGFSLPVNKKPWIIGERFDVNTVVQSNQDILQALDMGLEGVHIHLQNEFTLSDWQTLLDKVILTYITLTVSFEKRAENSLESLASYLQQVDWEPNKLLLHLDNNASIPSALSECKWLRAKFNISTNATSERLARQIYQAELLLSIASAKQIFFEVELCSSFYHNIIFLQALKILWQNILEAHQLDPHTPMYIFAISVCEDTIDENTQKINGTVQAVSAVVAGVQYLEIQSVESEDHKFNQRINRNIQHLLKLESFMDRVMNPTAGSYYFDQLTKELAEASWTKFQNIN